MSGFLDSLKRRRAVLEDRLTAEGKAHTYSIARTRLHDLLKETIARHVRGRCLDAGTGRGPFRELLRELADEVVAVDVAERPGVDHVADVQSLPIFPDASFDSLICSQVLEHVPRPWDAFAEFARVLKPGGSAVISVPHLSMLHELPHDYYRYTEFGLRSLSACVRLEAESLKATGGLICFLGHFVSQGLMTTAGALPVVGGAARSLNSFVIVPACGLADRAVGLASLFPCDYVAVFKKADDDG